MRVLTISLPYFLVSHMILSIQNTRIKVTVVVTEMPNSFMKMPTSVPITITKSNMFHQVEVKYR